MSTEQIKTPIQVLIVEDSEFDARIIVTTMKQGGYAPNFLRVETPDSLQQALDTKAWDIVISDYNLPDFNALDALKIVQAHDIDLPFIIVSGGIGEPTAVDAMKAGAHDYVMKGNQTRLCPALHRELKEAGERRARRRAELSSRENNTRYRLLWETASDAILITDTEGTIQFANPASKTVFGYPPDALENRSLESLFHTTERSIGASELLNQLSTSTKSIPFETVARRADGKLITVELSHGTMILKDQSWWVLFVRDVTERREAERTLRENEEQFRLAREIQERLFPIGAPALDGFDIAGKSIPASSAGGDYFDYIPMLNGRIGLIAADVSGHGVGPALLMAETRAYLRILARNRENIGEILTRANLMLSEDLGPGQYITLLLASMDPVKRTIVHANAGHPAAYILDQDGTVRTTLKRTGVPLGMHAKTTYEQASEIQLSSGDLLLLHTDGVEDSCNPEGECFERDRIIQFLANHRHLPARTILELMHQATREFAKGEPQHDDFTAIVVKVL